VEVLIDLGRPGGHLSVAVVLFFGTGRLVEVLDLVGTPLPGKHIGEEAAEGDEDARSRQWWWWLSEERRRVRSSACGGDRSERRETDWGGRNWMPNVKEMEGYTAKEIFVIVAAPTPAISDLAFRMFGIAGIPACYCSSSNNCHCRSSISNVGIAGIPVFSSLNTHSHAPTPT
jgi:hypothetical protein